MKPNEVHKFVLRYLNATDCHINEKSPSAITARLSPEADKDLTNRTFYWSFVERTGAEPETMTLKFVFDPEYEPEGAAPSQPNEPNLKDSGDSILGRYFGFVPSPPIASRIAFEDMTYGSRKLSHLFNVVRNKGRIVHMFEDVKTTRSAPATNYDTWLCVNYKVEFCCDMKREEMHSLGVSLTSGEIREQFFSHLSSLPLTSRLPANTIIRRPIWSVQDGMIALEHHLEQKIRAYSHDWAVAAQARLSDELVQIDEYYGELLRTIEEEHRAQAEAQYDARKREVEWQYSPRIEANVINVGVFHLNVVNAPAATR